MKKFLVSIVLVIFTASLVAIAQDSEQQTTEKVKTPKVQSTEGVETDENIDKAINSSSKSDKREDNQKKKKRAKYLRNINKIEVQNNKKRLKNRDLEFLESRLELKKNKLEKLNTKTEVSAETVNNTETQEDTKGEEE